MSESFANRFPEINSAAATKTKLNFLMIVCLMIDEYVIIDAPGSKLLQKMTFFNNVLINKPSNNWNLSNKKRVMSVTIPSIKII